MGQRVVHGQGQAQSPGGRASGTESGVWAASEPDGGVWSATERGGDVFWTTTAAAAPGVAGVVSAAAVFSAADGAGEGGV
ncbi:hypothetical protein V490_00086 [Pseudogymnoascus sp. VKM F-3557]|nr:hypothetical protein V490_00086 [Pseudogymnoascus sp. VKM F-3557]